MTRPAVCLVSVCTYKGSVHDCALLLSCQAYTYNQSIHQLQILWLTSFRRHNNEVYTDKQICSGATVLFWKYSKDHYRHSIVTEIISASYQVLLCPCQTTRVDQTKVGHPDGTFSCPILYLGVCAHTDINAIPSFLLQHAMSLIFDVWSCNFSPISNRYRPWVSDWSLPQFW